MGRRLSFVALLALALPAAAQDNPDEDWKNLPSDAKLTPQTPARDLPPPPPMPAPAEPSDLRQGEPLRDSNRDLRSVQRPTLVSPRPVLEPNTVSMFGARSLGQWTRGEMIYLGFPLIGIRLSIGLLERLDVGVGFDSFYTMMNEPRLTFRYNFYRGTNWSLAAALEGGYAWFTTPARADVHGARWLTGRRNGNIVPGLMVSYQGDHPRAVRLFASLQYMFTIDTEPFQDQPLGGVPSSVVYGGNVLLRLGAEMPLSAKTSFVFQLGGDYHGRDRDSVVMPVFNVGIVTSI